MPRDMSAPALVQIHNEIVACEKCPRLRKYGAEVARVKRRAYRDETYWGKPVPGFGDAKARLLIVGLAPGAHGANRTGRVFTGDRSGDYLYRALFENGFANQAESRSANDGLKLMDVYITGAVRCAPPDNKPARDEFERCRPYMEREIDALNRVRVIVALGKIAADVYLGILRDKGEIRSRADYPFGHGREYKMGYTGRVLLCSYHPSQQNTSTGRLTSTMLGSIFARARTLIEG